MNLDNICLNCLNEKPNAAPCPHCGYDNADYVMKTNQLPPYTILNGKYLIGRAIGAGGFGIVYLAKDLYLNYVVAIKELFPATMMGRNTEISNGQISTSYFTEKENIDEVKEKFIREARIMAQYQTMEGIVQVKDLFEENGTAYFVMEYLDGIDLKEYMKSNGKLTFQETITLLKPILYALKTLHRDGIIHRDISPDNVMLLKNGHVKLLDFGGIKNTSHQSGKKSEMVMLKRGYTPLEQYSTEGNIGPWTDIYALCATIYKCITGETLQEPIELMKKSVIPPSQKGVTIPEKAEKALLKGLEVSYTNRIQDIQELIDAFYTEDLHTASKVSTAQASNAKVSNANDPNEKLSNVRASNANDKASNAKVQRTNAGNAEERKIAEQNKAVEHGSAQQQNQKQKQEKNSSKKRPIILGIIVLACIIIIVSLNNKEKTHESITSIREVEQMKNCQVGDHIYYGKYEQDNSSINGEEEIEWKVLAKEDNRILVISRAALDCKKYNEIWETVTWETSSIRKWLNSEFINDAFTEVEKSRIPTVTVTADNNSDYDTNPGNNTQDKVFLLSIEEVNNYFRSDEDWKCESTEYAIAQGAYVNTTYGSCKWWLRTPGDYDYRAAYIRSDGTVNYEGIGVDVGDGAVRPAMWIDLDENASTITVEETNSNVDVNTNNDITETTPGGTVIIAQNENYTMTANVNLRSDCNAEAARLATIPKGTVVTSTGICENGWLRVEYNGQVGYITSKYAIQ